ncbi:PREDICTED: facilitated trehalose transporter Tret1 isoform X2 [Polistes dominula]|uniref:Facilitated trehalose transporter Tret1 isoform X2 n=1 Tax=Polistes dominula TaxID=743375 RepID=A0ABM1JFD3_POLDO|nr:PREDICTED: facilitated trehalose transporter Tret1 isoform X2 [Polistes dominula]
MPSNTQRRQIMQPWPLCLVPFAKTKERSVLPNYYTRVPSIARSSTTSSGITLDCASNATLATNASPFNSQTALLVEKKKSPSSPSGSNSVSSNHYYVENLRNNHQLFNNQQSQKSLTGSRIYDPLDKGLDVDYKQLDPLIAKDLHQPKIGGLMNINQEEKDKDATTQEVERLPPSQFQKDQDLSPKRFIRQVLAALTLSLGSLVVGFASSYTSPALVSMQSNATDTNFEVTKQMGMWIGSIMPLSALIGGIAGGPFIEYLGRRNTILGTAVPFIVAWVLIGLAQNIPMILAGRAICGFCVGITTLSLPVYLGETIQPEVRGSLGLLPTVFGNTGILTCFIAGMYLNWRYLALLGSIFPIPFLILMFLIPETPRWYISKGKAKRARKSLQWLRGKDVDITEELTMIEELHVESEKDMQNGLSELLKPSHIKPILISLGLMFFQQMSGINAVIFYTVQIFKDAGSTVDENISTIIVGIVNFLSTFIAAVVIDKLGRKMLLYASGISMFITLFTLGCYFYVKISDIDVSNFGWIPLLSMIIYVIGFSLGFGPIPWLMMGEILPARIRGTAASIATAFNWTCTFVVTKTYEDFKELTGAHGTFWFFGIICALGVIFVYIWVPETRGRSLEEIEKRFAGPVRRMSAVANLKPTPMGV